MEMNNRPTPPHSVRRQSRTWVSPKQQLSAFYRRFRGATTRSIGLEIAVAAAQWVIHHGIKPGAPKDNKASYVALRIVIAGLHETMKTCTLEEVIAGMEVLGHPLPAVVIEGSFRENVFAFQNAARAAIGV